MTTSLETMQEMRERLAGCGAEQQITAVISAIKKINTSSGWLDQSNRQTAIYWIATALAGTTERAADDLIALADLLQDGGEL